MRRSPVYGLLRDIQLLRNWGIDPVVIAVLSSTYHALKAELPELGPKAFFENDAPRHFVLVDGVAVHKGLMPDGQSMLVRALSLKHERVPHADTSQSSD